MDIGLVAAFFGGVLALLSPCAALLLPAFFASSVTGRLRLGLHALVFYLGLVAVLVPLGLGIGALGALFTMHRSAIVIVSSLLLIIFGIVQLLGFGFDPARFVPGAHGLHDRAARRTGLAKTVFLGAASGLAGACSGPILGAVLTLAAARGDVLLAGMLLAVYASGMVVPLVLIAWAWTRMSERTRRALRGRTFTVLGRRLHTTSVLTGGLLIGVGVVFWVTNGLVTAPALVPASVQMRLQQHGALLFGPVADIVAIVVVAVAILAIWAWRGRRARPGPPEPTADAADEWAERAEPADEPAAEPERTSGNEARS